MEINEKHFFPHLFVFRFSEAQLAVLNKIYEEDKRAVTFLSNYQAIDVVAIKLSADSANIWSISPPDEDRMIEEVNSSMKFNNTHTLFTK